MSYITEVKGEEHRLALIEKQDKLLAEIRKIVGNKKFTFSDAYIRKSNPTIGVGERPYSTITRKYVYVSCFLQHNNNEDCTEWGAVIKKFPITYIKGCGEFVNKVELEDLFSSDLEKILNELKFYLWWEVSDNLPKVRAEYERLLEIEKKYKTIFEES